MALWKDTTPGTPSQTPVPPAKDTFTREPERPAAASNVAPLNPAPAAPRSSSTSSRERLEMKESVIASDLTIEGKIIGSGHVRLAGRFKGDVQVDGNLTIDHGATVDGQVRAQTVTVGGELKGNIENAKRVELLEGGVITGDVKAGSLTVAAGSRMRGQVEFGWEEEGSKKASIETKGFGTAT
jgi:cytoskeletal protein CcmA (bactofilin family)